MSRVFCSHSTWMCVCIRFALRFFFLRPWALTTHAHTISCYCSFFVVRCLPIQFSSALLHYNHICFCLLLMLQLLYRLYHIFLTLCHIRIHIYLVSFHFISCLPIYLHFIIICKPQRSLSRRLRGRISSSVWMGLATVCLCLWYRLDEISYRLEFWSSC